VHINKFYSELLVNNVVSVISVLLHVNDAVELLIQKCSRRPKRVVYDAILIAGMDVKNLHVHPTMIGNVRQSHA